MVWSKDRSSNGRDSATPDAPVDRGLGSAGDGEHAVVGIDGGNRTVRADAPLSGAGQDPCPTAHVENPGVAGDASMIEHVLGKLPEQGGDEDGVVDLCCGGVHLPPFRVGRGVGGVLCHGPIV